MTPATAAALFGVAVVGGVANSIAGGGTFITFPTLLLAGVPSIPANATNTTALWPGVLFSLIALRREAAKARFKSLMAGASFAGGTAGALLLLKTPQAMFDTAVPFLLLAATTMFAFNPIVARRLAKSHAPGQVGPARVAATTALVFLIAVYGGYFGGGIGLLILGALGILGLTDYHDMNAFRLIMSCSANFVAVIVFAFAGAVAWPEASVMLVGAILGGYGGARVIRHLPASVLRRIVVALGLAMSAYFFYRRFV
jgi:uncharacterized membrane protein YfcA